MPSPDVPALEIGGRRIATDMPPFIIAEIGLNHGGSVDRALAMVDAAIASGAQAVKLQPLVASSLVAPSSLPLAHVAATSLIDFFRQFELDGEALHTIIAHARSRGLKVLATALSEDLVDQLGRDIDAFKIASGDLTWDQLIVRCARTGKPLVLSTGMAGLDEVRHAVNVAREAGAVHVAVLHCVSAYPVPEGSENLLAIRTLADACGVPVGLSDHGADTFALPIAVALGAALYERHLVLEADQQAVDLAVSSTSAQLARAVEDSRRAWLALGSGRKQCLAAEAVNLEASRRSLCAARDLAAGDVIQSSDLIALRPSTGLPPSSLPELCGQRLVRPLRRGDRLTIDALGPADQRKDVSCVA